MNEGNLQGWPVESLRPDDAGNLVGLFLKYLTSRGISKSDAEGLLVNGFIDPITKEIPLEYSIELNRLINLEMAGSVG